ncbi:hypothetical protein ALC56_07260 [Trachymyrmex septentrionalis]|uniref:Uncharacterized protein n=1 Tax=Trachymyrmex septentrionalis TaxID=34720 RepID=A0A195FC61_9HYME|nr:hypothetical protein ALC56_07260 [Trachymyrmex septentrionalis]
MRTFYTILILVILFVSLGECWSFSNIAMSIDKLIRPQNTSQVLNINGNGSATSTASPEVTVQGRIIFVPRRNKVYCQPGQQADRRGKCRQVW